MTRTVDGAPAVQVGGGRLRGRADGGVAAFLGIPYAVPPLGGRESVLVSMPAVRLTSGRRSGRSALASGIQH